jgi:trehalose/maltose transport system substrate-binding protein
MKTCGHHLVVAVFGLLAASTTHAATVAVSCAALGREFEICREGAQAWAAQTGNTVRLVSTPNSGSERLALYQQLLAARAPELDVLQIDVVWPGILARHLVDLSTAAAPVRDTFYPQLVSNDTVAGRLVALPWFVDVGLLYYRSDLLARHGAPVPRTWQELTDTAARIQRAERAADGPRLWGFVWQGRTYEGLTCDALEWLASQGGGTIVDPAGNITVNNPRAAGAITRAASWVGRISPKGVLNYAEEESRGVFQSGQAIFMRNWPYAWNLLQSPDSPVRGKVGVALLPAAPDGQPAAALGGQQLAVSRYSRNREAAISLVLYLTGRGEQKRRALVGGYHPTIPALYDDPEILASSPLFGTLRNALADVVARPSAAVGADYNRLSYAFANAVHTVLAGQSDAESSLRALERQLRRLKRRGNWPAAASDEAPR